jgi:hypothetical protein
MEPRGIVWEAYEHHHHDRGSEWFWILGILTVASTIAAVLLGNALLGMILALGGALAGIGALREPKIISYGVTARGIRIDDKLFPYTTLDCFCIDEESHLGPQLLIRSEKLFMPLIIIPLPEDMQEEIEQIIAQRIPEEHLEEPFIYKVLEYFKF